MKDIFLIKHTKGAFGLRMFGLGPNFKPNKGLQKLQRFLNQSTFRRLYYISYTNIEIINCIL